MATSKRTALVTGASGLAGGCMLAHLLEQRGWNVVAVSRRKPKMPGDYRHIAVDLLDLNDCRNKLSPLGNISTFSIWPSRSVQILPRRCRSTPTCSSTSSKRSRPPHPR
jgi:NAD(P)-dependent dehydrogenase (short-subunit alcohol dehydrogenase family)